MCNGKKTPPATSAYKILATSGDSNDDVIKGIDCCQEALAEHHCKLYQDVHTKLTHAEWFSLLSCGRLREHIKQGVDILHAVDMASGEVLGYLSYKRFGDNHGQQFSRIKVNHIVVLAAHRGRGIGRQLFSHIFERYSPPEETGLSRYDYSIVACEFNIDAIAWYRRLGFAVTGMHVSHRKTHPVCYIHMHRLGGNQTASTRRIFGSEMVGQRLEQVAVSPSKLLKVLEYDAATGLHRLESDATVDLTCAFATGHVQFERPLHDILGLDDNQIVDTAQCTTPSVAATCLRQRRQQPAVPRHGRPSRAAARLADNILGSPSGRVTRSQVVADTRKVSRKLSGKLSDSSANGKSVQQKVAEDADSTDVQPWEKSVCKVCGDGKDDGAILLCDGLNGHCNATYHYYCVGLCEIPDGDWFCPLCSCVLKERRPIIPESRSVSQKRSLSSGSSEVDVALPLEDNDLIIDKGCALGCGSAEDALEHYLGCKAFFAMLEQPPPAGLELQINSGITEGITAAERIDIAIAGYAVAHAVRDCRRLGYNEDSDAILSNHLRQARDAAKRLKVFEGGDESSDASTTSTSYTGEFRGQDLARTLMSPFLVNCIS